MEITAKGPWELLAFEENFGRAGGALDERKFVFGYGQLLGQHGADGLVGAALFRGRFYPHFKSIGRFLDEFVLLFPRVHFYLNITFHKFILLFLNPPGRQADIKNHFCGENCFFIQPPQK